MKKLKLLILLFALFGLYNLTMLNVQVLNMVNTQVVLILQVVDLDLEISQRVDIEENIQL